MQVTPAGQSGELQKFHKHKLGVSHTVAYNLFPPQELLYQQAYSHTRTCTLLSSNEDTCKRYLNYFTGMSRHFRP